ncbi:Hydrolase [Neofusicoccum parvum]|nr:Hydrolase [Neofusicoccum parvum]
MSHKEPEYEELGDEDLGSVGQDDNNPEEESAPACKRTNKIPEQNNKRVDKGKIFRWADLPGEIRNIIYELCLTRAHPLLIASTFSTYRHIVRLKGADPQFLKQNLLLINKSTYAEGGPLLYQNEFLFENPLSLVVFMTNLSAIPKAWIEKIELGSDFFFYRVNHLYSAISSLTGTTNLTRLSIHKHDTLRPDRAGSFMKVLYKSAHFWLEAVGKWKGDRLAGVELIKFKDEMGGCHSYSEDLQNLLKSYLT